MDPVGGVDQTTSCGHQTLENICTDRKLSLQHIWGRQRDLGAPEGGGATNTADALSLSRCDGEAYDDSA